MLATALLLMISVCVVVIWWYASPRPPPRWPSLLLLALAALATTAMWGREEIAALCLRNEGADLRTCVAEHQQAYPHRAAQTRSALMTLVDQTCTPEPWEQPEWLIDHLHRLDRDPNAPQEVRHALARDVLRHTCQRHAQCCTAVLRLANARQGWSSDMQQELKRWNNTLPWQTR